MKYGALIGWGIVIYAVMYLIGSGLLIYGFAVGIVPLAVKIVALIATAALAGRALRLSAWKDALPYSLGWAGVAILLDGVFWVPFAGWNMYASIGVWLGYALLVLVPVTAVRLGQTRAAAPVV